VNGKSISELTCKEDVFSSSLYSLLKAENGVMYMKKQENEYNVGGIVNGNVFVNKLW